VAALGVLLSELWKAAEYRRKRNKATGAVRILQAYAIFIIALQAGNTIYLFCSRQRELLDTANGMIALRILALVFSIPLLLGLTFSRRDTSLIRRAQLIDLDARTGFLLKAISQICENAPLLLIGSVLPVLFSMAMVPYGIDHALCSTFLYPFLAICAAFFIASVVGLVNNYFPESYGRAYIHDVTLTAALIAVVLLNPAIYIQEGTMLLNLGTFGSLDPSSTPISCMLRLDYVFMLSIGLLALGTVVTCLRKRLPRIRLPRKKQTIITRAHASSKSIYISPQHIVFVTMVSMIRRKGFLVMDISVSAILSYFALNQQLTGSVYLIASLLICINAVAKALVFLALDSASRRRLELYSYEHVDGIYVSASLLVAFMRALPPLICYMIQGYIAS
jgi:hypothetical protein